MSSTRRTANEINILAILDRHQAAGLPQRVLRGLRGLPGAAWYGAANVLVCVLVGMLAWLARDSPSSASVDGALAGAVDPKPAAAIAAAPAPVIASLAVPVAEPEPAPEPVPSAGATVVDVVPAPAAEPLAPLHPLPPQQHAGRITPHAFARDPQRLSAHATEKSATRAAAGKPAGAGARAAPGRIDLRNRRPAAMQKAVSEPVDTDVALSSAIIQHANKRQEAEEAARKP
jgi:hypothetical protein